MKPERTTDELPRHMQDGSFEWCVDRLDLGDFDLTRIAKGICLRYITWPEQLLGRARAGDAVSPTGAPVSTGACAKPSLNPSHVHSRRLVWRIGFLLTDLSIENLAAAVGGYSAGYVRPWATSWRPFEEAAGPSWWPSDRLWIRRLAEPMGVRPEDLP